MYVDLICMKLDRLYLVLNGASLQRPCCFDSRNGPLIRIALDRQQAFCVLAPIGGETCLKIFQGTLGEKSKFLRIPDRKNITWAFADVIHEYVSYLSALCLKGQKKVIYWPWSVHTDQNLALLNEPRVKQGFLYTGVTVGK